MSQSTSQPVVKVIYRGVLAHVQNDPKALVLSIRLTRDLLTPQGNVRAKSGSTLWVPRQFCLPTPWGHEQLGA